MGTVAARLTGGGGGEKDKKDENDREEVEDGDTGSPYCVQPFQQPYYVPASQTLPLLIFTTALGGGLSRAHFTDASMS